jgi:hypothetical protein
MKKSKRVRMMLTHKCQTQARWASQMRIRCIALEALEKKAVTGMILIGNKASAASREEASERFRNSTRTTETLALLGRDRDKCLMATRKRTLSPSRVTTGAVGGGNARGSCTTGAFVFPAADVSAFHESVAMLKATVEASAATEVDRATSERALLTRQYRHQADLVGDLRTRCHDLEALEKAALDRATEATAAAGAAMLLVSSNGVGAGGRLNGVWTAGSNAGVKADAEAAAAVAVVSASTDDVKAVAALKTTVENAVSLDLETATPGISAVTAQSAHSVQTLLGRLSHQAATVENAVSLDVETATPGISAVTAQSAHSVQTLLGRLSHQAATATLGALNSDTAMPVDSDAVAAVSTRVTELTASVGDVDAVAALRTSVEAQQAQQEAQQQTQQQTQQEAQNATATTPVLLQNEVQSMLARMVAMAATVAATAATVGDSDAVAALLAAVESQTVPTVSTVSTLSAVGGVGTSLTEETMSLPVLGGAEDLLKLMDVAEARAKAQLTATRLDLSRKSNALQLLMTVRGFQRRWQQGAVGRAFRQIREASLAKGMAETIRRASIQIQARVRRSSMEMNATALLASETRRRVAADRAEELEAELELARAEAEVTALERDASKEESELVRAKEEARGMRSLGRHLRRWQWQQLWGGFSAWRSVTQLYAQEDAFDEIELLRMEVEVRTLERDEALEGGSDPQQAPTNIAASLSGLLDGKEGEGDDGEDEEEGGISTPKAGSRAAALQAAGERLDALVASRRSTWAGAVSRGGGRRSSWAGVIGRSASMVYPLLGPLQVGAMGGASGASGASGGATVGGVAGVASAATSANMTFQAQLDDLESLVASVTESTTLMAAEEEEEGGDGEVGEE